MTPLETLWQHNLGGDGTVPEGGLSVALARDFGPPARWRAELERAPAGGWRVLGWSLARHRLVVCDAGADAAPPGDVLPLLALPGGARLDRVDFAKVAERYATAVAQQCVGLAVRADEIAPGTPIVDVRRAGAFAASGALIDGADWRDPEQVDAWGAQWAGRELVVYCVFGHEVGQSTAARLCDLGANARFLLGGFEDWQRAGRPVRSKEGRT